MGSNQKWLIALIDKITPIQWFFLAFGAITLFFIRLMMNHQNRMSQRNFKKEEPGSSRRKDLTKID
jgi:type II secretory pathway component PulF